MDNVGLGIGVDGVWLCEVGAFAGDGVDRRGAAAGKFAGIVLVGDFGSTGDRFGGCDGHVFWIGYDLVRAATYTGCVYLVRDDWIVRYVRGWGGGESDDGRKTDRGLVTILP